MDTLAGGHRPRGVPHPRGRRPHRVAARPAGDPQALLRPDASRPHRPRRPARDPRPQDARLAAHERGPRHLVARAGLRPARRRSPHPPRRRPLARDLRRRPRRDLRGAQEPRMALLGLFVRDGHATDGVTPVLRLRRKREIDVPHRTGRPRGLRAHPQRRPLPPPRRRGLPAVGQALRRRAGPEDHPSRGPRPRPGRTRRTPLRPPRGNVSVPPSGDRTFTTTSPVLAGQVQELAVKLGGGATVGELPAA